MNKLATIAFTQMLLGGLSSYKPMYGYESKSPQSKPKSKKVKPSTKVVYCIDENGQIKRKKVSLEEAK